MAFAASHSVGRIRLVEDRFTFPDIEPTQELLESSAEDLGQQARAAAQIVQFHDIEILVVTDEGSLKAKIGVVVSIAWALLTTDYKTLGENILWLEAKANQFTTVVEQRVLYNTKLPSQWPAQDPSAIVTRRSTLGVQRLKAFYGALSQVRINPASEVLLQTLAGEARLLLRQCPTAEDRAEVLRWLEMDEDVRKALRRPVETSLRADLRSSSEAGRAPAPRGRPKLKRVVRHFSI